MNQLHNMKFRIDSPEHAKQIYVELNRLGYFIPFFLDNPKCIIAYNSNEVFSMDHLTYFEKNPATETTLEELKLM